MAQWLGLRAFMAKAWLCILVRKLKIPQAAWHDQMEEKKKKDSTWYMVSSQEIH